MYVSISGGIRESKPEENLVNDLRSAFRSDLNDVLSKAKKGIELEHADLMRSGAKNSLDQTIVDVMRISEWYGPSDYDLYQNLADYISRVTMGVAINILWEFDNAYFVQVDYPAGCEVEKQSESPHGPRDYLVCLPELPYTGFWLYSIDRYKAETRGPTGFLRLNGDPKYAKLALEHAARSSLHVHQKNLMKKKGQRLDIGPPTADSIFNGTADEHADIKGVFTIPICENPDGKAVSGVLDPKGQNYPCMCGQPWNIDKRYLFREEQTPRFLALSGLMFSKHWEDYCDNHNDCDEESDVDLHPILDGLRDPKTDPEIPKKLKHPYRECKAKDSRSHPGWPDRDRDPKWGMRSKADWAMLDGMQTNSTRRRISFEA